MVNPNPQSTEIMYIKEIFFFFYISIYAIANRSWVIVKALDFFFAGIEFYFFKTNSLGSTYKPIGCFFLWQFKTHLIKYFWYRIWRSNHFVQQPTLQNFKQTFFFFICFLFFFLLGVIFQWKRNTCLKSFFYLSVFSFNFF